MPAKKKKKTTKATKKPDVLKFQILDDVAPPLREAYKGDVGYDLVSTVNRTIPSSGIIKIPTGIKLELPNTLWASIREKSGVSIKTTLSVKAGVIDPGYRGEVNVIMFNHSLDPARINRGDKIAQIVLHPVVEIGAEQVDEISEDTERGDKGFGSSDK
jgi:dUTP pyrophosphatase